MARRRRRRRRSRSRGRKRLKFQAKPLFIIGLVILVGAFIWTQISFKEFKKTHALKRPRKPIQEAFSKPPARSQGKGAKIVFVIDDMGHTTEHLAELDRLGNRVTYSILPFLKHSQFFEEYSRNTGAEVILHLPMESVSGTIPGPGLITSSMSDQAVSELIKRELDSLPMVKGANNHMGSKGTSDPRMMKLVLAEFKRRRLFFLDSFTTSQSVVRDTAVAMGVPVLKRDVFLDNVDEKSKIREQVDLLASVARLRGYAVGIGHYRQNTLQVLAEEIPRLRKQGYDIISLGEMLRLRHK